MVDDVKQELREKLLVASGALPRIADYLGEGPLTGWVRVSATRTALNLLRRDTRNVALRDDDMGEAVAGARGFLQEDRRLRSCVVHRPSAPRFPRRSAALRASDCRTG